MCAYMENTVYAIRCVCLYILCSGGHTGFVSLFIQDKNREQSEHKQAARETSTLLWGKEKSTNKDREQSEHLIWGKEKIEKKSSHARALSAKIIRRKEEKI